MRIMEDARNSLFASKLKALYLLSSFLPFAFLFLFLLQETTELHDALESLMSNSVGHRHTYLRHLSCRRGRQTSH